MDKYRAFALVAVIASFTVIMVTKSYEAAAFLLLLHSILPSILPKMEDKKLDTTPPEDKP